MSTRVGRRARAFVWIGAVAWTAAAQQSSEATLLQAYQDPLGSQSPSFWAPDNWFPSQVPGPGDTAEFNNASVASGLTYVYLGDVGSIPAQVGEISRLHFDGSLTQTTIDWGSPSGGQAGGLVFSQDDAVDFGIGIRVARIGGPSSQVIYFLDANNTPADAMNVAIGTQDPFSQGGLGDRLFLYSTTTTALPTLHVDNLLLENDGAFVEIGQNVVASNVQMRASTDAQVLVGFGELTAATLSLNAVGANQTPLHVTNAGSAVVDSAIFAVGGPGNDATIAIDAPSASWSGVSASFGALGVDVWDGARATLLVDAAGGSGQPATLSIGQLGSEAAGGTIELLVRSGGVLTGDYFHLNDSSNAANPGTALITVDGAGSRLEADVDAFGDSAIAFSNQSACSNCDLRLFGDGVVAGQLRFESGARADGGNIALSFASATFEDAAVVNGSALRMETATAATISDTTSARFAGIQLDPLIAGGDASLTIADVEPSIANTEVVTGTLNLASDLFLLANGTQLGGDRPGANAARLSLGDGALLRVGDDPLRNERPTLTIGTNGSVTLAPTSSAFIGDASTPALYEAGRIVLDDGGFLYGHGSIDGAGFAAGTHPTVHNTGGEIRPGTSVGALTIAGTYVQDAGVLTLEIGGVNPGDFDVLDAIEGVSFLGGTLRLERLGGFLGVIGAELDFFAGRSASFAPELVIEDLTGLGLVFDSETGVATITQVVPEPSALALVGLGLAAFASRARRRRG